MQHHTALALTLALTLALGRVKQCLGVISDDSQTICPGQWQHYEPQNICLQEFRDVTGTFEELRRYCRSLTSASRFLNSDVVAIRDEPMAHYIENLMDVGRGIWVGLKRRAHSWTYLNGEGNAFFREETFSSNTDEDWDSDSVAMCVAFKDGAYTVEKCSRSDFYAMCQLSPPIVADLCMTDNGGCTHKCHPSGFKERTCSCPPMRFPIGYMLHGDGKICKKIQIDYCQQNNGGCKQTCKSFEWGAICSCKTGYKLRGMKDCVDKNECLDGKNGGCEHSCINTPGSFRCICKKGFRIVGFNKCERGVEMNGEKTGENSDDGSIHLPRNYRGSTTVGTYKAQMSDIPSKVSWQTSLILAALAAGIVTMMKMCMVMASKKKKSEEQKEDTEQWETGAGTVGEGLKV